MDEKTRQETINNLITLIEKSRKDYYELTDYGKLNTVAYIGERMAFGADRVLAALRASLPAEPLAEHAEPAATGDDGAETPIPQSAEEAEWVATQTVLEDVAGERMRQRAKWGNDRDDRQESADWVDIINAQLWPFNSFMPPDQQRRQFLRIAAVAVAAIEAMDRAEARTNAERRSDTPPGDDDDISDIPF